MHPPSPGLPAPETPALPYTPGTRTIELCEAASAGNLQAVQRLLDVGTSVDAKDASGFTPLHRAVQHGHQQIARHLLSHGADTSATTTSGGIPTLHLATAARDAEMARILLDHGAFIELPVGRYGLTPLHLAVGTGPENLVKLLLERGANPKARCQPELDGGEAVQARMSCCLCCWRRAWTLIQQGGGVLRDGHRCRAGMRMLLGHCLMLAPTSLRGTMMDGLRCTWQPSMGKWT